MASVGIDAGVLPPTSDMWPNIDAQPTMRPSTKIGITTSQSLAWLIAAPQEYGSEVSRTSPSSIVPSKLSRKSGMDRPNWPTTIFPSRVGDQRELVVLLADAGRQGGAEQHLVHLVAGVAQRVLDEVEGDRVDVDLRSGVVLVSIRRAMAQPSWLWSTGRMRRLPLGCDGRGVAGQHEGGGVHLGDHGRARRRRCPPRSSDRS